MARQIQTGIDWDEVRRVLDSEPWETDPEGWPTDAQQTRRVYLGSVFSLYPSGKFYTPWACSNLEPCPVCGGSGRVKVRQSNRRRGKARARMDAIQRKMDRLRAALGIGFYSARSWHSLCDAARSIRNPMTVAHAAGGMSCTRCGGIGSAEAADDEVYRETLEAEAAEHGLSVEHGEGDPCDIFIAEYRDTPDDDTNESDD